MFVDYSRDRSVFVYANAILVSEAEPTSILFTLQVHGPGADIDTLCVGPSYVNREVTFATTY